MFYDGLVTPLVPDLYECYNDDLKLEYERDRKKFEEKASKYTRFYCLKQWTPEIHAITPPACREVVKLFLLCLQRNCNMEKSLPLLPRELQHLIIALVAPVLVSGYTLELQ